MSKNTNQATKNKTVNPHIKSNSFKESRELNKNNKHKEGEQLSKFTSGTKASSIQENQIFSKRELMKQYCTSFAETQPKKHQRTNSSNQEVISNIKNEKSPTCGTKMMTYRKSFSHKRELPTSNSMTYMLDKNNRMNVNTENEDEYSNSTGQNENGVMKCLEQSIKIIEKIQVDFEMSAKNNLMNSLPESELNRIMNEIKKSDLSQYIFLSQQKKNFITNEITELSELRIKNYSSAFEIINSSIGEIKEYLNILASQCIQWETEQMSINTASYNPSNVNFSIRASNATCQKQSNVLNNNQLQTQIFSHQFNSNSNKLRDRYSCTDQELSQLKLGIIEEGDDEQCDFSEYTMYENALVLPPKSSPFNYLDVKDIIRLRSKKFSIRNPSPTNILSKSKCRTLPEKNEDPKSNVNKVAEDDEAQYIEDDMSIEGDDEQNDCEKTIDQFNTKEIFPKIQDVKATIESEKANHSTNITTGYENSAQTAASHDNNKNNSNANCLVF